MEGNNGSETKPSNNDSEGNNTVAAPQVVTAVPGQPWVPVQYVIPPPGMIPVPHYPRIFMPPPPPYHHQHYQVPPSPQNNGGENRTLWVGDLHDWMEEEYLHECFAPNGEVINAKIIRNRHTGVPEGYGFVEFSSHAGAEKALQTYTSVIMPKTEQTFRLNWATFSMGDKRSNNNGSDLSIFVGDLASDVTDTMLHETFASKYPSVKTAKVVVDANTSRSKGYGFVRFGDDGERSQAMTEMNGVYCSSRPMRIGPATPRKSSGYQQQQYSSQGGYSNGVSSNGSQSDGDSVNTTVFVGGLDPEVTDEDLRQPFSQYGEIVSVKIPVGKGCGFVQFANRSDAEASLKLTGTTIGKQTVRLSWGRSPANRQSRAEYGNQWTGSPYYGGPFFDGHYAYAGMPHPHHDPNMYAAHFGGYPPMYANHHRQQVS